MVEILSSKNGTNTFQNSDGGFKDRLGVRPTRRWTARCPLRHATLPDN